VTSNHGFVVTSSRRILDAAFLGIDERRILTPDGSVIDRIVITHPGAVAVVPLIGDDIILIEQYRPAADALVVEIPAGKLESTDTDREGAALRELREETGYTAETFVHLTDMWPAVGFSDEVITILLATELVHTQAAPDGAEERAATIHRIPFMAAVDLVVTGEITDSKTIAGIMIAHAHRSAS
jgi:ADP-ribose pyrophosphatase